MYVTLANFFDGQVGEGEKHKNTRKAESVAPCLPEGCLLNPNHSETMVFIALNFAAAHI